MLTTIVHLGMFGNPRTGETGVVRQTQELQRYDAQSKGLAETAVPEDPEGSQAGENGHDHIEFSDYVSRRNFPAPNQGNESSGHGNQADYGMSYSERRQSVEHVDLLWAAFLTSSQLAPFIS